MIEVGVDWVDYDDVGDVEKCVGVVFGWIGWWVLLFDVWSDDVMWFYDVYV